MALLICLFASLENGAFPFLFSMNFQRYSHNSLADSAAIYWNTLHQGLGRKCKAGNIYLLSGYNLPDIFIHISYRL